MSMTPFTSLPWIVCLSTLPYPVTIISAYFIFYLSFTIYVIVFIPGLILALKNTTDPAPNPPAAPPPYKFSIFLLNSFLNLLFKFLIPFYNFYKASKLAPF